jgi:hypothetical protein
MELTDLIAIPIVGVVVSALIELITRMAATKPLASKFVAIGASLVAGIIYYFARGTAWFASFILILGTASAFYALFLTPNKS